MAPLPTEDRERVLNFMQRGLYSNGSISGSDDDVLFCPKCLMDVDRILHKYSEDVDASDTRRLWKVDLRTVNYDFWVSAMCFITSIHVQPEQHDRFLQIQRECPKQHSSYTNEKMATCDDLSYYALWALTGLVILCLDAPPKGLELTDESIGKRWPSCVSDLLPCGPQESAGMLVALAAARLPKNKFLRLLVLILHLTGNLLLPHLLDDENRTALATTLIGRMETKCATMNECIATKQRARLPELAMEIHLEVIRFIHWLALRLGERAAQRLFRGHLKRLLKACDVLLDVSEHYVPGQRSATISAVTVLKQEVGAVEMAAFPQELFATSIQMPRGQDDMYMRFHRVMQYARTERLARQCHGPGCGRQKQQSGVTLQKCARCGIMLYCSRECQRGDWKAAVRPHKDACELFSALPLGGANEDAREFSRRCAEAGIKLEQLDKALFHALIPLGTPDHSAEQVRGFMKCESGFL